LAILACESGNGLYERIVDQLEQIYDLENLLDKIEPIRAREVVFANGEIKTEILDSVRGVDLYIVQCFDDPLSPKTVNDNLMALLTASSAAKHADAEHITLIVPQFPYCRQERRKSREAITAKLVTQFMESAGADRVVTIDIHSESIGGFFSKKFENLHAGYLIIDHIKENYDLGDFIVVSPDVGSAERARFFAKNFQSELAIIDKVRNYSQGGCISHMNLVGSVDNKNIFMGDDMIATGGTLISACELLKNKGARDIFIGCTHPFFNAEAVQKFDECYKNGLVTKVIGTDAVYRGDNFIKEHEWYEEVTVSKLFAQVIHNINKKRSISELLL
jgi:ribose-phosphate pyrophosphokinase